MRAGTSTCTGRLALLRHGESEWNASNRFARWVNVALTRAGEREAIQAGRLLAERGWRPSFVHTSLQRRAIRTADLALAECDRDWIPVRRFWRLNSNHYGALQGRSKDEVRAEVGERQFMRWRRGWDAPPLPLAPAGELLPVHRPPIVPDLRTGMGERTTPMAVEILARALFSSGQADQVIAVELPRSHAMMHLDTVMTMIDRDTFVLYPYITRDLRSWTITQGEDPAELNVSHNQDVWDTLATAAGADAVTVLTTDEDIRAAEREQRDDGNTYLAIAPGVILATNATPPPTRCCASTASRWSRCRVRNSAGARGGPRCMTCPIQRDPA